MYEELIKNLRICSRCDFGQDCNGCTQDRNDQFCCDILLHNAADAIEELSEICTEQGKVIAKIAEEKVKELPVVDVHGLVWGDGE